MPRKAAAAIPAAPKRRGRPPRSQVLAAAAAVVAQVATAQPAPATAPVQPESQAAPESKDSLQRGRNIDRMPEPELRRYARQIGISQRDAEGLSVERLRQNCTAQLYELIEDL